MNLMADETGVAVLLLSKCLAAMSSCDVGRRRGRIAAGYCTRHHSISFAAKMSVPALVAPSRLISLRVCSGGEGPEF